MSNERSPRASCWMTIGTSGMGLLCATVGLHMLAYCATVELQEALLVHSPSRDRVARRARAGVGAADRAARAAGVARRRRRARAGGGRAAARRLVRGRASRGDRKSTRLNSSHTVISY